jgi:hypothetical protein
MKGSSFKLHNLQKPGKMNGTNLNNVRHEISTSFKNKRISGMYVLHNYSGVFARVLPFTFANDASDVSDVIAAWDH